MHAVTYKTDNLRQLHYQQAEGIPYTDQQWIFTPMFNVTSAYYIPETLYMYCVGREGQAIIGAERRSKQISDTIAFFKAILGDYADKRRLPTMERWAKRRLFYTINSLYKTVLFHYGDEDNKALRQFDTFFCHTYPSLYKESGTAMSLVNFLKYSYLPYWRNNGKLNPHDIPVRLYKAFYKAKMQREGKKYIP